MRKIRFLADSRLLLRQAVAAWIILFVSTVVFTAFSVLLSVCGLSEEQSIIVSLTTVGAFAVAIHIILYEHEYSLRTLREKYLRRSVVDRKRMRQDFNEIRFIITAEQQKGNITEAQANLLVIYMYMVVGAMRSSSQPLLGRVIIDKKAHQLERKILSVLA